MNKVYISKNYSDKFTASSKAKYDCEIIVEKCGYTNIGLSRKFYSSSIVGKIWTLFSNILAYIRMPKDSIVFLQYPVAFYSWQIRRAKYRNNRIITIIHDLNILRSLNNDRGTQCLELSDVLIVHTDQMKEWCTSNIKCKKIVVLEIFDYLYNFDFKVSLPQYTPENISIAFAGNLAKSLFIDNLKPASNITFRLFGVGIENRIIDNRIQYIGSFPSDLLWNNLNSHFGLVWDGESTDTCSGGYGYYLKYIAPHKLSLYISCGVPVIVWKESAMSSFVINNKIGLVISSFNDLYMQLSNLTKADYDSLASNVTLVRGHIINGYYLNKALSLVE